MKKIISGIILLLIAVVLITPFCVGIAAEKQINKQISKLSKTTNVTISNVYKRNWFSSNAEISFNLSELLASYNLLPLDTIPDSAEVMVKTRSEIIHGPFSLKRFYPKQPMAVPVLGVAKNITTVIFPPDILDFMPTVTTYISIFPNGSMSGIFNIPKIDYTINDGNTSFKSSEINGEVSFSSDLSKSFFTFNIPDIFLKDTDRKLRINGLECSVHSDKKKKETQSGDFKLGFDSAVTDKVKINNCAFSSFIKEKDGNLFFNTALSIKSFKDDNTDFGSVEIELSGKRIKKDVYKQLTTLLGDLNNKSENQFAHILLMTQIMALLPELLSESPEINLKKFDINTPDGRISANASIKVDKNKLTDPNNLKEIIKSINFDFFITIPETIAEKYIFSSENPRSIMLQKMMVKNNFDYTLNLKYTDSQFSVNGKPFSPDTEN